MKTVLKSIALILLMNTFLAGKAHSAVLNNSFLSNSIKSDLAEQVHSMVEGNVSVEVGTIPINNISVPDSNFTVKSYINSRFFTPRMIARVVVSADGNEVKTFGVPVMFKVYNDVWVANDIIKRGEAISTSNASIKRMDVGELSQNVLTSRSQLLGDIAKKTFRPGEILDSRFIDLAPLVTKNTQVSVIFKASDVMITIPCDVLDDGKAGDYVRVKSKDYKKEYKGKVLDSGSVLVNI